MRLLFFFLFSCNLLFAQNSSLSLTIMNEENKILHGASVTLLFNGLTKVSNYHGKVVFESIQQEEISVRISFLGYATRVIEYNFEDKKYLEEIVILDGENIPAPEVVVTGLRGDKKLSSITFSNISASELQLQTMSKDIPKALSNLPSSIFYSENGNAIGYTYLRIRGFDQRRISVFINGIPQNDPEDHNVYWINFYELASSLEDIQVQRGAGGNTYGSASIGGSINLITKLPSATPSVSSEIGIGSFNTQKFNLSLNSGLMANNFILNGRVSRVLSSGYREWAWTNYYRYFLSGTFLSDKQIIRLNLFGGPQQDGLAFYGIPKNYNESELRKTNYGGRLNDREWFNQPQLSLHHEYFLNEKTTLRNCAFFINGYGYFDFDGSWGTTDYFRLDPTVVIPTDLVMRASVDNKQYGWLPQIQYNHDRGRTILGAELRFHQSLHWGRIQSGSGLSADVVGEADKRFYQYRGGKNIYSFYVSHLHQFDEKITVNADIQFLSQQYRIFDEKFVNTEFTTPYLFVNPKLGVNYKINDNYGVYLSLALTRREPPLKNLYDAGSASWRVTPQFNLDENGNYDFDNPLVVPEKLFNLELGSRYTSSKLNLNTNLYWMEFYDEIIPSGGLDVFGQPRVGNADKTRHVGIEIESAYRIMRGFDFNFNLNLSSNRFLSFVEYDAQGIAMIRDGNNIANAPEIIYNASVNYNYENLFASLLLKHVGKQFTDNSQRASGTNDDAVTVDAYYLLDAKINYKLPISFVDLSVFLEINNLLNDKILLIGFDRDNFFPAAERNFFFGIRINYL